jgi:hypothetical protein
MKYKDLFRIRAVLANLVDVHNMSNWEIQKSKEKAKKTTMTLIESYEWVVKARSFWGSLA